MTRGIPGLIAFPLTREFERDGVRVKLSPQTFALVFMASAAAPNVVPADEIFAAFWGDDPEGGPLGWLNQLRVLASEAFHDLRKISLAVRSSELGGARNGRRGIVGARGRYLGGYRAFDLSEPERSNARSEAHAGHFLPTSAGGFALPAAFHPRQHTMHRQAHVRRPVSVDVLHFAAPVPDALIQRQERSPCRQTQHSHFGAQK